ncbi:MAG: hypothetical protein K1X79_09380 [Oligoflexia bacterium]|nr:hypothetical protein [Oligoflexia bacterium]
MKKSISELMPLMAICLVSVALWLVHCRESFWLDELQTYWVVSTGLQETVIRAFDTQGFTPFYYVVLWAWRALGFHSEAMLRLPSLLCIVSAGLLLFQLARGFFCQTAALLATLAFFIQDDVIDAALFARPYALALLLCIWSCVWLQRWVLSGSRRHQYAYLTALLLTVYAHYLFAGVVLIHLLYVTLQWRKLRFSLRNATLTITYMLIGFFPLVPQVRLMLEKRAEMQIAPQASLFDLLISLTPWLSIFSMGLCFFLALAFTRHASPLLSSRSNWPRGRIAFLAFWALFPAVALFVAGKLIGNSLLVSRYFLWAAPGFALLAGQLADRLSSDRLRQNLLIVLAIFCIAAEFSKPRIHEDWRAATSTVREWQTQATGLLVLYSGVSESARSAWLMDEIKRGQFASPLSYYGVAGDALLLPLYVSQSDLSNDFWEREVRPALSHWDRVYLVCLDNLLWQDQGQERHICEELPKMFEGEALEVKMQHKYGRVATFAMARASWVSPFLKR